MSDVVTLIPIAQIRILNPRQRDRKKFEIIVQSIRNLGLKKPIQVSVRAADEGEAPGYDLVCGQGRIEAFLALGHKEIPAIVVEISKEDRLLRSLVENIARRFPSPTDMMREIERLQAKKYTIDQIANKLDVSEATIKGLLSLQRAGEERLINAALTGRIPLGVAIDIARTDTVETQRELLKAFESKRLNQVSIRVIKRLIDQRRFSGKKGGGLGKTPRKVRTNTESLVHAYKRESQRQRSIIRKARICDEKLLFIVTAFDKLLADQNFVTLLRAESLANMPKYLWSKLAHKHKEIL